MSDGIESCSFPYEEDLTGETIPQEAPEESDNSSFAYSLVSEEPKGVNWQKYVSYEAAKPPEKLLNRYAVGRPGNYALEMAITGRRPIVKLSSDKMNGSYGFMFPYHLDSPLFVDENLGEPDEPYKLNPKKPEAGVAVHEWSHTLELDEAKNRDLAFQLFEGAPDSMQFMARQTAKGYG